MNPPTDQEKIREKVKKLLAEHIGVEPEDINDDDAFIEDLHMNPSELVDFSEKLEIAGFDITKIDFTNLEKMEDLVEALEK
jgi:acyl carrier protein